MNYWDLNDWTFFAFAITVLVIFYFFVIRALRDSPFFTRQTKWIEDSMGLPTGNEEEVGRFVEWHVPVTFFGSLLLMLFVSAAVGGFAALASVAFAMYWIRVLRKRKPNPK